ncbi:hypothetical protein AU468_00745 [Alkalispirochaeta sphaeroplastigenens]|uniref:DNA polymerase IV n=1 Tax=Alkalispirochaeta sphaeroplastigenens TaxID=1187066 RepID=A0A2S4K103_9SPIO|nr:DNA polymerase IV [Alkalispirochaeta sphaeroplastigenens]POR05436.1 hypothetical protein AU468_00745 [Alkalispirochaeta sphaeroplastigenens]
MSGQPWNNGPSPGEQPGKHPGRQPGEPPREKLFFHVDMDAFFASVEQLDTPAYRGKPLLVGGRSKRGVVAACSYEARRFGIHSAMPMQHALKRCPQAIVAASRMERYRQVSREITSRFENYSPRVQIVSIDEAFLEMTGTERLLGPPEGVARNLKEEIRTATGLTISVGIGPSRLIAKLASDVDKPDGLYRVFPGEEASFVAGLKLKDLWGLGAVTRRRLEQLGINTVLALREQRAEFLRGHFGASTGDFLYQLCRGQDPGIHEGLHERHSISAERTFADDIDDPVLLKQQILAMAEEVIQRSLQEDWRGPTVQVKLRFPSFETHSASRTLTEPPGGTRQLAAVAWQLLEKRRQGKPLRLLGVGIAGQARRNSWKEPLQQDLFPRETRPRDSREDALDPTIRQLRDRFGSGSIRRGLWISPPGEGTESPSDPKEPSE